LALTTLDGQPAPVPFAWSYSKLDSYRTCPKKLYHSQIKKDFPEPQNDDMKWGFRVHEALAKRIMHSSPLPEGMKQWEKWVDWALQNTDRTNTIIRCEQKLAITEDMKACEYFDKRVRGNVARLIDWKTGKVKEDSDQLALTAAAVMSHFPEVEHVLCQFVWLKDDLKQEDLFSRGDLPALWVRTMPEVELMRRAHATGEFPPKPSGLCKRHCAVISCAYHGRGAY
jgi:hypothetical protein